MGVRTIGDYKEAAMYCSVNGWAFGPIFDELNGHDARERIDLFIEWLPEDPRKYNDIELHDKYVEFLDKEKLLWAEKIDADNMYDYTDDINEFIFNASQKEKKDE